MGLPVPCKYPSRPAGWQADGACGVLFGAVLWCATLSKSANTMFLESLWPSAVKMLGTNKKCDRQYDKFVHEICLPVHIRVPTLSDTGETMFPNKKMYLRPIYALASL